MCINCTVWPQITVIDVDIVLELIEVQMLGHPKYIAINKNNVTSDKLVLQTIDISVYLQRICTVGRTDVVRKQDLKV